MVAKARKKGLVYRLKRVFDWLSRRYRRWEEPVIRWAIKKRIPATLTSLLSGLVRLSLIGFFLFLTFWVLVAIVGGVLIKNIIISGFEVERKEKPVWMDAERLFPDAYAPENIHDPAFNHDHCKR